MRGFLASPRFESLYREALARFAPGAAARWPENRAPTIGELREFIDTLYAGKAAPGDQRRSVGKARCLIVPISTGRRLRRGYARLASGRKPKTVMISACLAAAPVPSS